MADTFLSAEPAATAGAGAPPTTGTTQPSDGKDKTTPPAGAGDAGKNGAPEPIKASAEPEKKPTDQGKDGAGKDGDAGKKPTGDAAAELELKFPEGVEVDKKLVEAFKPIAKAAGMKAEHAQQLVDLFAGHQKAAAEQVQAHFEKQHAQWAEELKTDKEIGGASFDQSQKVARNAVAQFGGKELAELLDRTGLSNNPVIARTFVRIGKALAEDTMAEGKAPEGGPKSEEALLRSMYPSMFPTT